MGKTSWAYSTTVNDIKNAGLANDRCPFCTGCLRCLFPFSILFYLNGKHAVTSVF